MGFHVIDVFCWNSFHNYRYFSSDQNGLLYLGYGDIACVTVLGRIATVVYSLVGIPLMLITLNELGKFLYSNITGCVKVTFPFSFYDAL